MTEDEKIIFDYLDKDCRPNSTPIPNKLTDEIKIPCELLGFFGTSFMYCFHQMRESNGETDWKFDCSYFIDNICEKNKRMTKNQLHRFLLEFFKYKIITSIEEKYIIKFNVTYLFDKELEALKNGL